MTSLSVLSKHYETLLQLIPQKPFLAKSSHFLLTSINDQISTIRSSINSLSMEPTDQIVTQASSENTSTFAINYLKTLDRLDKKTILNRFDRAIPFIISPLQIHNLLPPFDLEIDPEMTLSFPSDSILLFHENACGIDLKIEGLIGEGTYGCVLKKRRRDTLVACKTITDSNGCAPKDTQKQALHLESVIYSTLSHPNIIRCLGFNNIESELYLEFSENSSLQSFLIKHVKSNNKFWVIPQKTRIKFFLQLTDALRYLHKKNLVHCDIKPANILLTGNLDAKLGDFGLTKSKKRNKNTCLAPLYAAPESLDPKLLSEKLDLWALGVVIHNTFRSTIPYPPLNPEESSQNYRIRLQKERFKKPADITILFKEKHQNEWNEHDPDHILREAMKGCLDGDPEKRWDAETAYAYLVFKTEKPLAHM